MERGRPEVSPKLNRDAEHVPKRQPLASPVPASIPKVDHVAIARKRFAWSALACVSSQSTSVSANAWIHGFPASPAISATR